MNPVVLFVMFLKTWGIQRTDSRFANIGTTGRIYHLPNGIDGLIEG